MALALNLLKHAVELAWFLASCNRICIGLSYFAIYKNQPNCFKKSTSEFKQDLLECK